MVVRWSEARHSQGSEAGNRFLVFPDKRLSEKTDWNQGELLAAPPYYLPIRLKLRLQGLDLSAVLDYYYE